MNLTVFPIKTQSANVRAWVLLSLLIINACKKEDNPVTPVIPLCSGSGIGTSIVDPNWIALPTIPTTTPAFADSEKIKRSSFTTGMYNDGVASTTHSFTVVANAMDKILYPTDLDINPVRPDELWVTNFGEPYQTDMFSRKSFTVTLFTPGKNSQFSIVRKDKAIISGHFFSYPTSMAFNKDGYWASTSLLNNNGFNGPTLWSSDFAVYGDSLKYKTNGSHSSMLHESRSSLGIASDENNTFWIVDGTAGDIVSYNFGKGHFPGGEDHTDGVVRRYELPVRIQPIAGLPNHISYDLITNWLYVLDPGKRSVLRLKTTGGTKTTSLSSKDAAKEYLQMTAPSEVFLVEMPLQSPCGIDTDGTRLYISDYESGAIAIYELTTKQLVGMIQTGSKGVMGIRLDKGNIWYVNHLKNELVKVML